MGFLNKNRNKKNNAPIVEVDINEHVHIIRKKRASTPYPREKRLSSNINKNINSDEFVIQSSTLDTVDNLNSPDQTTVTVDATRTTAFVENTDVVKASWRGSTAVDDLEVKYMSIRDFLAKPYLLNSLLWASTDTSNTVLWTANLANYLTSVTAWANKLIGFNLVRGTFHIRVEVIANRFQQGMLVAHYLPNEPQFPATYALMHNATLNGVMQQPHILINAADSAAEIVVPYIAPTTYISLPTLGYSWGTAYLRVLSALNSGPAGELNARVNVYGWIEDVELAAPLLPQAGGEDMPGPITTGLKHVASAAASFSKLPMLNEIGRGVEWAARMASGVASIFGWSKPTNSVQPQIVSRSNWRYNAVSDGADNSVPLGLIHDNELDITNFSIRSCDEMSTKFLYSIPNFVASVPWTTTTASGTTLISKSINPGSMGATGTSSHGGHTATWRQGAPAFYLARYMKYWRGSMKIKFKVIKTEMHKGKLQITFTPTINSAVTAPDLSTSIYSLRHIVDIAQKDTFEFVLPYLANTHYILTSGAGDTDSGTISGQVDVIVLNELRAPETCAPTVDILYWLEPGDDFELAGPGAPAVTTISNFPFVPQSSIEDKPDTLISGGIGGSRAQQLSIMPSEQCMGEHFTSIKQLLNRLSQSFQTTGTGFSSSQLAVWPYYSGEFGIDPTTGAITSPLLFGDALSLMMPCYAYMRGGVRVSFSPNNSGVTPLNANVSLVPFGFPNSNQVVGPTGYRLGNRAAIAPLSFTWPQCASTTETDFGMGMVSAKVPYQSRTPVMLCATAPVSCRNTSVDASRSCVSFGCFNTSDNFTTNSSLYRSCCDDFQLHYFVGCPPILTTYT